MEDVVAFYKSLLGFSELGRFKDHDGFDRVMLGHAETEYHLEFTHAHGHHVGNVRTQDNLLVFYIPDVLDWRALTKYIEDQGILPMPSFNPYWDRKARTCEDPDGYRVVIQNAEWTARTNRDKGR